MRGILTKGLGKNLPACQGMIINQFSLSKIKIIISYGGGGYPQNRPAWNRVNNIQNFYKPTPQQPPFVIPLDNTALRKYKAITVTVQLGTYKTEKIYKVPENKLNLIINVINIVNTTKQRVKVLASNIKVKFSKMIVKIRNLTVRRK